MTITLAPGLADLAQLESIYRDEISFNLTPDAFKAIEVSASRLLERLEGKETIYGVNTGFGKLASVRIDEAHLASLQLNMVRSHCAGFGEPLPLNVVRLIMALTFGTWLALLLLIIPLLLLLLHPIPSSSSSPSSSPLITILIVTTPSRL